MKPAIYAHELKHTHEEGHPLGRRHRLLLPDPLYFSAEAAILVAAAACDVTVLTLWVSLPFVFKRSSCLLLHVLDALAEDDDGVPRARAPLRLSVP